MLSLHVQTINNTFSIIIPCFRCMFKPETTHFPLSYHAFVACSNQKQHIFHYHIMLSLHVQTRNNTFSIIISCFRCMFKPETTHFPLSYHAFVACSNQKQHIFHYHIMLSLHVQTRNNTFSIIIPCFRCMFKPETTHFPLSYHAFVACSNQKQHIFHYHIMLSLHVQTRNNTFSIIISCFRCMFKPETTHFPLSYHAFVACSNQKQHIFHYHTMLSLHVQTINNTFSIIIPCFRCMFKPETTHFPLSYHAFVACSNQKQHIFHYHIMLSLHVQTRNNTFSIIISCFRCMFKPETTHFPLSYHAFVACSNQKQHIFHYHTMLSLHVQTRNNTFSIIISCFRCMFKPETTHFPLSYHAFVACSNQKQHIFHYHIMLSLHVQTRNNTFSIIIPCFRCMFKP